MIVETSKLDSSNF